MNEYKRIAERYLEIMRAADVVVVDQENDMIAAYFPHEPHTIALHCPDGTLVSRWYYDHTGGDPRRACDMLLDRIRLDVRTAPIFPPPPSLDPLPEYETPEFEPAAEFFVDFSFDDDSFIIENPNDPDGGDIRI